VVALRTAAATAAAAGGGGPGAAKQVRGRRCMISDAD